MRGPVLPHTAKKLAPNACKIFSQPFARGRVLELMGVQHGFPPRCGAAATPFFLVQANFFAPRRGHDQQLSCACEFFTLFISRSTHIAVKAKNVSSGLSPNTKRILHYRDRNRRHTRVVRWKNIRHLKEIFKTQNMRNNF